MPATGSKEAFLVMIIAAVFALWLVVGLVMSSREAVHEARASGYPTVLGLIVGVFRALPF